MPAPGTKTAPRSPAPGASRSTRVSLRKEISAPPSESPSGDRAIREFRSENSCALLRRHLEFSQQELIALDPGLISVKRPWRGSAEHFAVNREQRVVAGTDEFVFGRIPVIRAS